MGRKNKNIMGGAASGAGAGMAAGPWGAAAGAVIGGIMGSQNDTDPNLIAPAVPQDVIDKLYRQSQGAETTVGEMKASQMFDKTLAQQIAAARAGRGVNPALQSRNVARIAAEQSQAAAAQGAEIAAAERAKAMTQYLSAQQLNAQVNAKNVGQEDGADKQANNMLAGGLSGLSGALALNAQKGDAAKLQDAQDQKIATESNSVKEPINTSNLSLNSSDKAQQLNSAYGLGADTNLDSYKMEPEYSDKNLKTDVMKVTSDERQKDLIKTENLPTNNNMGMQNMQAAQPMGQQSMAAPAQSMTPAPAQAQAPAVAPEAPKTSSFGITSEMLQQAQKSSKSGGNVGDIKNDSMTLQRGAQGPSNEEIINMTNDAQRRQSRDMFGNVTQSDAENYQANLGRWTAARDAQNAAYDKQAGEVSMANQAKDAQRTSRLNRFYTGIDTSNGALASQYKTPVAAQATDWHSAQAAQRAAGIGDQSSGFNYGNLARQTAGLTIGGALGGPVGMYEANRLMQTSDETQKEDVKSEGKTANFSPKSFLDKLEAYSYNYKDSAQGLPGVDGDRHLSVMAQDLEKAGPVGESMVDEDGEGNKVVDYGKGFGAILASQAHLNKRLEQIEKQYGSKKKKD